MEILNYQVSDGQSGIRIDRYLSEMNKELSRSTGRISPSAFIKFAVL